MLRPICDFTLCLLETYMFVGLRRMPCALTVPRTMPVPAAVPPNPFGSWLTHKTWSWSWLHVIPKSSAWYAAILCHVHSIFLTDDSAVSKLCLMPEWTDKLDQQFCVWGTWNHPPEGPSKSKPWWHTGVKSLTIPLLRWNNSLRRAKSISEVQQQSWLFGVREFRDQGAPKRGTAPKLTRKKCCAIPRSTAKESQRSPKDLHGMSEIGFRCDTFAFPILQKKNKTT